MKIFESRKLTDAEFVERTRKNLQKNKRRAWFMLVLSLLFIAELVYILNFAVGWFDSWKKDLLLSQAFQQYQSKVLVMSASFGCIATIPWLGAVFCFCEFLKQLFGNRRDKLLIAYYDQLHSINK
jgi:hypothetical protein